MTYDGTSSGFAKLSHPECQTFVERVIARLQSDGRFNGLLIAGSGLSGEMDEFSDLDLILVCRPECFDKIMTERRSVAESFGELLAAFTGEHVGEPALLICLFNKPLLHVDLKFIVAQQLSSRVEDPVVAWSLGTEIETQLSRGLANWPNLPPEWFEERFWIWIHYAAQKAGRGELFEATDLLALIRQQVLGPMNCRNHGKNQRGVRRVEQFAPTFAGSLQGTLCVHEKSDVLRALHQAIAIYRQLRAPYVPSNLNEERARIVVNYVGSLQEQS
jgi:hypothetical protein